MRIGLFSDRYLPQTDGVCFSIETFRIELEKLGHEVYVIAPSPGLRYKEPSKRIIRFPAVKGLFWEDQLTSLYFPPQALRQIDKLNLDIVHFQTPGQIGLLGAYYAIRHHKPLISTYHTDLYEYVKHYPQTVPASILMALLIPVILNGKPMSYRDFISTASPRRSLTKWAQNSVVSGITAINNRCDLVIVPSRKIYDQLMSWGATSTLEVLPTGVDKITTNAQEIASVRKAYSISEDDQVILSVCRISTEKNIGLLIRAFATIGRRNQHAKLVIAGEGDDMKLFQKQAAASPYADRIIFTGHIDRSKLGALYEIADVFGFPSTTDTQGMVVNEAARAGTPIVMVDPEISQVVVDGENGYISRNGARDFAAKVIRILSKTSLREQMSKRSLELSAEVSAGKQAIKLLRLYEETIERYRESSANNPTEASRQL